MSRDLHHKQTSAVRLDAECQKGQRLSGNSYMVIAFIFLFAFVVSMTCIGAVYMNCMQDHLEQLEHRVQVLEKIIRNGNQVSFHISL